MTDDFVSEAELRERCRIERELIVQKYDLGRVEGAEIDDWEDPKFEIYLKQDRYGFLRDDRSAEEEKKRELDKKQVEVERARSVKWASMINSESKYFAPKAKEREKMVNRIYKGVPDSVRGRLWYILLEIDQIKREKKGVYEQMKELARRSSPDIRQIDLDVNRTYRDHSMFRLRYNGRQKALFHVLAAYSMYNTEVGYCQGMSQIAALLLMYLVEEEDAFWALSQLVASQKYAMHGFFIPGFPKLIRFQMHHDRIFKKFMPKLKKHFDKHGIDSGIYTLKWFFQCFLDRLPFSLTLRVWDLYLLEGERVLIATAHTILKMHRRYLSKLGMDEIIEHLQIRLADNFGYEDEKVIERLREVLNDLRSQRLDSPGKIPPEELPQKPFGIVPTTLNFRPLPLEKEMGLRTGFTATERKYSEYTIMKQEETEKAVREEHLSIDDAFEDDGSDLADESASLPGDSITQPTTNDGDDDDDDDVDLNASFDGVDTSKVTGVKSPIAITEAENILDESMRYLLKSASDLNGGQSARSGATSRSTSRNNYFSAGGMLDSSFESTSGEVLRIYVPYTASNSTPSAGQSVTPDHLRYEGDKVFIKVNHSPLATPTNDVNPSKSSSPSQKSEAQLFSRSGAHSATFDGPNQTFSKSGSQQLNDRPASVDSPIKVSYKQSETLQGHTSSQRKEIRSMHTDSYTSFTSKVVSSSTSTTYLDRRHVSSNPSPLPPKATSTNNNHHKI